ncbi:MAG: cytochrome c [Pseudarcicella sp.]|nr:cytochrome c [Pseudarcicella sp.]
MLFNQLTFRLITVLFLFICTQNFSCAQNKTTTKTEIKKRKSIPRPAAKDGAKLYTQHCENCHQKDGSGVQNMNPPLVKTSYVQGDSKQLITILLKGLSTGVVIDGEEYNNPMPSFSYLKDDEIAAILNFIRHSWGNTGAIITPGEVTHHRKLIIKK